LTNTRYSSHSMQMIYQRTLLSLIFLKEKEDKNIKARSCANENPQREHIALEEAAASTVALESTFITSTIDKNESRKVVTIDIPGAFSHTDNDGYVIMKMAGMLAELMVKTNPRLYRQCVVLERGRSVLYLQFAEGSIRNDEECIAFLQEAGSRIARYGV
jgi:hypothetical protein